MDISYNNCKKCVNWSQPMGFDGQQTWLSMYIWTFYLIPTKNVFIKLTPLSLMRSGQLANMKFCVYIWKFHALSIKIIFSEIATNSFPVGVGLLNLNSVHIWTFTAISNIPANNVFSEFGPNSTCWRDRGKTPIIQ